MKINNNINLEELKKHNCENPFLQSVFYQALLESQSIGERTGWLPIEFSQDQELSLGFIKQHSYGEYIFDWAWADLYHRVGLNYYPKLIHAIPFTPVNAPKIINEKNSSNLIEQIKSFYLENKSLSGHHYLFITKELSLKLEKLSYFTKYSIQYHWPNRNYENFDDFLSHLKSRKRKQIKKERRQVIDSNLIIKLKKFSQLNEKEIQAISQLYISTINKKHSYAYLRENFFTLLLNQSWDQGFAILAYKQDEIIAMSLFFHSKEVLYGRYWGIKPKYEFDYKFLHFEMCYYRGIDYCIENKINLFEAGAQGEHKLLRGFNPTLIYSSHMLRHEELGQIIRNYTDQENKKILKNLEELKKFTPYKI